MRTTVVMSIAAVALVLGGQALLAGYHTYLKALLQVGGPGLAWPGWLPELAPVALEEAAEGALPQLATPGAFASIH